MPATPTPPRGISIDATVLQLLLSGSYLSRKKIMVIHIINSWSWLLLREQTLHLLKKLVTVNLCKLYLMKKKCCKQLHLEKIPLHCERTFKKTSIKLHRLMLWITIWTSGHWYQTLAFFFHFYQRKFKICGMWLHFLISLLYYWP